MDREDRKLELYLLLSQCSSALIVSLINAARASSPYIQAALKQKLFQLAETLRLFLREHSFQPQRTSMMSNRTSLGASRSIRDMSSAFNSSRVGRRAHSSTQDYYSMGPEERPRMRATPDRFSTPYRSVTRTQRNLLQNSPQAYVTPNINIIPQSAKTSVTPPSASAIPASQSTPTSPVDRFPVLQHLLQILAKTDDATLFSQSALPIVDDPKYKGQLMQEIDEIIVLTSDNMSCWGNETLGQRLAKMEINVETMLEQFIRLEQRKDVEAKKALEKEANNDPQEETMGKSGESVNIDDPK